MSDRITPGGVRRLTRVAERVERSSNNRRPSPPRGPRTPWNPGTRWAIVGGSAIPAAAAGTPPAPGSGAATLYDWDTTSRTWAAGDAVTIFNLATGASGSVAAGTLVGVAWSQGDWWIIWVTC